MDDELIDILRDHVRYHAHIEAPTREQQLQREISVVAEYRGRVLVELFQNAIDRADGRISISLTDDRVVVANDNLRYPLEVHRLDLDDVQEGRLRRSDFHALCSMDTSRKQAWEAIGNKGIGFKSVFREAERVEIWSRKGPKWWGFRLVHPFTCVDAHRIAARPPLWDDWQVLWDGIAAALSKISAPSFYFPEPLDPEDRPAEASDPFVTVVQLALRAEHTLRRQEEDFRKLPLHFVSARFPDKTGVAIEVGDKLRSISFIDGWTPWPERPFGRIDLVAGAAKERLTFTIEHPPSIQLAFPPLLLEGHRPYFHCFFPTQVMSGFGADVHADFLVDPSRKSVEFEPNSYNAKLLDSTADLLLEAVESKLHTRPDVWRFLTPGGGAHPELEQRVRIRLFGDHWDQPKRWLEICRKSFSSFAENGAPWSFYEGFWGCLGPWWHLYRGRGKTWETFRQKVLAPLEEAELPLIPLVNGVRDGASLYRGVPCPSRGNRTVLLRPVEANPVPSGKRPEMPEVLLKRVAITSAFPLPDPDSWAHIQEFKWAALVVAARDWIHTISPGTPRWSPDDPAYIQALEARLSETQARDAVLFFLYAMALEAEGSALSPVARLMAHARDRLEGGQPDRSAPQLRAEAAMPLPVLSGRWLPACRVATSRDPAVAKWADGLNWGVLDRDALAALGVVGESQELLTRRLGCFEVIPLISRSEELGLHIPFDPTTLPPEAWRVLLSLWEPNFAADATALGGLSFAASFKGAPWFPVGKLVAPPDRVWRVSWNDAIRYAALPLLPHAGDTRLLDALGIAQLPDTRGAFDERLDTKASASLAFLATCDHSLDRPREARLIFSRLARGLSPSGTPLPALVASSNAQSPEWVLPGHRHIIYLTQREREGHMRYFPDLLQVCSDGGAERAARWGARAFAPKVEVLSEKGDPTNDEETKARLRAAIPWLLAIAEVLRLGSYKTPAEVAAAWNVAAVARGGNVYLLLSLEGATDVQIGLRDQHKQPILNDAFLYSERTAWCDVPDLKAEAGIWLPRFAPWFAAVFGEKRLETPFRILLSRLGEDWDEGSADNELARKHLELHDIDPERVGDLRADFDEACWSPEECKEHQRIRRDALSAFGLVRVDADLLASILSPSVWEPEGRAAVTEDVVDGALRASEPDHGVGFACRKLHDRLWQAKKESLRSEVLLCHILREGIEKWTDEIVAALHADWDSWTPDSFDRIDFNPLLAAKDHFPGRDAIDEEELRRGRAILQRRPFADLENVVVALRAVSSHRAGSRVVVSGEKRRSRDDGQAFRGRKAEEARAEEAAEHLARAPEVLRSRVDTERARIRSELNHPPQDCLAPISWGVPGEPPNLPALRIGAHVASEVDCGYDVLDVDGDRLLRVEVKSHTGSETGDVTVFLTANELRRALETQNEGGFSYRLELYLGYGRRVDATSALQCALKEPWLRKALTEPVDVAPQTFSLTLSVPVRS